MCNQVAILSVGGVCTLNGGHNCYIYSLTVFDQDYKYIKLYFSESWQLAGVTYMVFTTMSLVAISWQVSITVNHSHPHLVFHI